MLAYASTGKQLWANVKLHEWIRVSPMEVTPKAAKIKPEESSPCSSVESSPFEYKEQKVSLSNFC